MKFKFLITIFLFLNCKSEDPFKKLEQENIQKVWAGPPEDTSKKPFEYLYMKTKGKASSKAIEKKSLPMMETTCNDSTISYNIGPFIHIFYEGRPGSTRGDWSYTPTEEKARAELSIILSSSLKYKNRGIRDCKPISDDEGLLKWRECECIVYNKIPGGEKTVERLKNDLP